ncbi:MAG: hypothetical protein KDD62_08640 [Bdellovibrionales bacterium]|nr:hypothetical protein [Bdellovibrionales bacterium]
MVHRTTKNISKYLFLACVLFLGYLLWLHVQDSRKRAFFLELVPQEVLVTSVVEYQDNEWGFGPGSNGLSVVSYQIAEESAASLREQGTSYFLNATGQTLNWQSTPSVRDTAWIANEEERKSYSGPLGIDEFIYAEGWGIELNPQLLQALNALVNGSAGYYAYRGLGLFIVDPEQGKLYLLLKH